MSVKTQSRYTGRLVLSALTVLGLCLARPVMAQDDGYHVGEKQSAPPPAVKSTVSPTHRVARIEYLSGKVTYRANDADKWVRAEMNHPLLEGGQLAIEDGGRAEVRFDDGSILRLGSNSAVTLQTVFVDAQGEYTQIKMNSGIAMLEPREERSVFEVDTPSVAVKTMGPSRIRIGVSEGVEVAVSRGRANLEGSQGKQALKSGDYVTLHPSDTAYTVKALPSPDSWERWNEDRDYKRMAQSYPTYHYATPYRSSFFLSLGFPVFVGGHEGFRHRW